MRQNKRTEFVFTLCHVYLKIYIYTYSYTYVYNIYIYILNIINQEKQSFFVHVHMFVSEC